MPLTYKEFYSELINSIPDLSPFLAKRLVNRAWKDIRDSRQWSFLKSEGFLYSPQVINSGSLLVTQFSNVVVANATAILALDGLSNPILTKRQIRFGSGATPIYNISVVSPTFSSDGLLYLDRPYMEATNAAIGFQCYRCYYGPPQVTTVADDGSSVTIETPDFLRYDDIYNPSNSRWFVMPPLAREILDRKDPQRSTTGNIPFYIFAYKSINNIPYYEMWPHPFSSAAYSCSYQRRGIDFASDSETLPTVIADELLLERAMFYACGWASANVGNNPKLKGVNWLMKQQAHKSYYSNRDNRNPGLLEIAQINDEELYPQQLVVDTRSYQVWPLGSDDLNVYGSINYGR